MARTWVLPGATEAIHVATISTPKLSTPGESPLRLATLASAAIPPALEGLPPADEEKCLDRPSV